MSSLPVPVSPRIEHRGVALRHLLDDRQDRLERAARADDAVEVVDVLLRVPEVLDLVLEAPVLDRLLDLELHLLDFKRLLNVVEGADLHRLDRRVHRAERGHQNHRGRWMKRLGGAQHVETVAAPHLQVAQHDIVLPFVQLLDRHVAVRRLVDFVMRIRQRAANPAPQRIVIICHQNPAHCSALSFDPGASPPRTPYDVARGAPRSPLRSAGSLRSSGDFVPRTPYTLARGPRRPVRSRAHSNSAEPRTTNPEPRTTTETARARSTPAASRETACRPLTAPARRCGRRGR